MLHNNIFQLFELIWKWVYEIKLLNQIFLPDCSKWRLSWKRCTPLMFLLSIYVRPWLEQKAWIFSWIFSSTSNDALVVKTKSDVNIFFTPNLRHVSTMYLILLKRFSVLDWLLLFKTSFIPAWIRTVSGVYIFTLQLVGKIENTWMFLFDTFLYFNMKLII